MNGSSPVYPTPTSPDRLPLHTSPTAEQICIGVADFLAKEVQEQVPSALRYSVRVATELVRTVARELASGNEAEREFAAGVHAFGMLDERELAQAVRDATVHFSPELLSMLEAATRARLAVSAPAYLSSP